MATADPIPTLFDRWTPEQEAERIGMVEAGLEPRLFPCWRSSTTEGLRRVLGEYEAAKDPLVVASLADVVVDLQTELAYRCAP